MKATHRPDIFTFSVFDRDRNLDFNGYAVVRGAAVVLVDPVAMSEHDLAHVRSLGTVRWVVMTNSDHVREAPALARTLQAQLAGPAAERDGFPAPCDRWLADGDTVVPGIEVFALQGSKTPGELALLVDGETLITGDLVRGHRGGALNLLPDPKLTDRAAALASVRRLAAREPTAVLVGDGWPLFEGGAAALHGLGGA